MLFSLYVIFSLILHNYNVNSVSNIQFSSRCSSLYSFRFYDKLTYITKYRGGYLQRRIPHASHGSFNPYIITNKQAHVLNGNIIVSNLKKNKATSASQQSQVTNNNPKHFMNYCLTHPGRFSCAVDSFLELAFAIFRD